MEQWATCWIHAPKLEQNKQKKERETEVAAYYQSTHYLLLSVAAFSKSATLAVQLAVRLGFFYLFIYFFFYGGGHQNGVNSDKWHCLAWVSNDFPRMVIAQVHIKLRICLHCAEAERRATGLKIPVSCWKKF